MTNGPDHPHRKCLACGSYGRRLADIEWAAMGGGDGDDRAADEQAEREWEARWGA